MTFKKCIRLNAKINTYLRKELIMNIKEAVNVAKVYVSDLFTDEQIIDLGLEEVEFDDSHKI